MRLRVDNLTLAVAQRPLCTDLTFEVGPGELWCILGRNGAGKTTLLRTLAGLRSPDGGSVFLSGQSLSLWPRVALARERGYLPQSQNDAFSATVLDTVLTGRFPHQPRMSQRWRFAASQDRVETERILALLGLHAMIERDVMTLSSGERQRVAIAALLVQDAPLMLLDEPTSHLDFDKQILVLDGLIALLADGARERALLMSVHDINLASRFASHILLFSDDARVLAGPVSQVLTSENLSRAYHHGVSEVLLGKQRWFLPS